MLIGDPSLGDAKRRFMAASRADGRGGASAQGVRWWLVYHVHGLGVTPFPRRRVTEDELDDEEEELEDFAIWLAVTRPSGRQISHESVGKYVSEVRAFLFRYLHRRFGRGHTGSIIPDLLRGYAREVDQPPRLERDGCTPEDLLIGMDRLRVSQA